MKKFPHFKQYDAKDCGPTCLKIIAKHYKKTINIQQLRSYSETTRSGSSLLGISEAAEKIGFRSLGVKISLKQLLEAPLPCILHWNKNHYVVLYKISPSQLSQREGTEKQGLKKLWSKIGKFLPFGKTEDGLVSLFHISDPAHGLLKYTQKEFLTHWIGNNATADTEEGIALLLETTPKFFHTDSSLPFGKMPKADGLNFGFSFLTKYVLKYKAFLWQLVVGLLAASLLQLILPFLTQSVVDVGIKNQDINFIYLILFAQLALFIGKTAIEVIRSWILLHLSTRINISLVSDFFIKLMNLPIAFFDTRMTGDILQRINDHKRIERILTTSSLSVLFSMMNLIVFSVVLAYYSLSIFTIFVIGSFLYFLWIIIF
jgi:ATP-binding cassette subfamily B protein